MISENQYGFREKRSTYMALFKLIDKVSNEMDNKQFSIGLFLDLSKAFDTIDHVIFLQKLQCYGISGLAFNWMKCYLSNRSQFVCIGGVNSDLLPIHCGVLQGFI